MKQEGGLKNALRAVRTRLGLSQQELAGAAGIARQTIGGIEASLYSPSAAVALRLARALGCTVEELFWLEDEVPTTVMARLAASQVTDGLTPEKPNAEGPEKSGECESRVLMGKVGGQWIAHSLRGEAAFRSELVPSDGMAAKVQAGEAKVTLLDAAENLDRAIFVAGCAPALSLWARSAERWNPGLRVSCLHANSTAALGALERGEVHIAGLHLHDAASGEDNAPFVRRLPLQPGDDQGYALVNFGIWDEGLVLAAGNPLRVASLADLAGGRVRLVNREAGAGARLLLDELLRECDVPAWAVPGHDHEVASHLAVARAVATGAADCGMGTAAIAGAYGLDFLPLRTVRYDLALCVRDLECEPVRQLLGTLAHRWVRGQLQLLGGYDTRCTGERLF